MRQSIRAPRVHARRLPAVRTCVMETRRCTNVSIDVAYFIRSENTCQGWAVAFLSFVLSHLDPSRKRAYGMPPMCYCSVLTVVRGKARVTTFESLARVIVARNESWLVLYS